MAITKEYTVNYEIVTEYKHIQVKEITHIMEDGKELSRTYHRRVLHSDADISNESDEIKGIANSVWTDEVKKAWSDRKKEMDAERG
tara:strand:- start:1045 stop:1302 length:258 start_codon:yes stop_codon:yes gene_type:complete